MRCRSASVRRCNRFRVARPEVFVEAHEVGASYALSARWSASPDSDTTGLAIGLTWPATCPHVRKDAWLGASSSDPFTLEEGREFGRRAEGWSTPDSIIAHWNPSASITANERLRANKGPPRRSRRPRVLDFR
jgi:hypothetical protein